MAKGIADATEAEGPRSYPGEQAEIEKLKKENSALRTEIESLRAVSRVAKSITSTLLIDEVLREILRGIREILSFKTVTLGLVKDGDYEKIKVGVGVTDRDLLQQTWKIDPEQKLWGTLLADQRPVVIKPVDSDIPGFIRRIFSGEFIKAPMIVKGELIGTIMASHEDAPVSEQDLRILQTLVEYAGVAVENGRLYYEMIRSEERLKKAQKQLVEVEKMAAIGQIAVSINHEINNPLCTISMVAQLLKQELSDSSPNVADRLTQLEENVHRIMEVTRKVSQMNQPNSSEYLPNQLMIDLK